MKKKLLLWLKSKLFGTCPLCGSGVGNWQTNHHRKPQWFCTNTDCNYTN